jgi:hypothetical protein
MALPGKPTDGGNQQDKHHDGKNGCRFHFAPFSAGSDKHQALNSSRRLTSPCERLPAEFTKSVSRSQTPFQLPACAWRQRVVLTFWPFVGVPAQPGAADVKVAVGHALENLLRCSSAVKLAVRALFGAHQIVNPALGDLTLGVLAISTFEVEPIPTVSTPAGQ